MQFNVHSWATKLVFSAILLRFGRGSGWDQLCVSWQNYQQAFLGQFQNLNPYVWEHVMSDLLWWRSGRNQTVTHTLSVKFIEHYMYMNTKVFLVCYRYFLPFANYVIHKRKLIRLYYDTTVSYPYLIQQYIHHIHIHVHVYCFQYTVQDN